MLLCAVPVQARVLSTRPNPSETFSPLLSLTVGGGVEYESDRWEFPFLIEYNFTEQLRLTVEPKLVSDEPRFGWGDLETTVGWEFLRERRYRPALSVEGTIRWPTASEPELGDPGRDYTIGLVASKDMVFADVDVTVSYTSIGDASERDEVELAAAGEVPLRNRWALLLESVTKIGRAHV